MRALWAHEDFVRFYQLRDAARKYRDLRVYEDNRGRQYFASMQINTLPVLQKRISFVPDYFAPDVAPAWLWISLRDHELQQTIYSDSPQTEVACRNPRGFGVIPRPGWEIDLLCKGYGKHVHDFVAGWMEKNRPLKYTGPGT